MFETLSRPTLTLPRIIVHNFKSWQWLQSAESTPNDGPMNSGPIEPLNFLDLPNLIDLLLLKRGGQGPPQHMLSRLLNRKDARRGHSRQPSRQARRRRRRSEKRWSVKNLSAILWRIWARGDFAKSRISHESRNAHCRVHLQRAPSVRVSKPKCPKFRPFTKPKYLNEFLRTTALLGVRNV